MKENQSQLTWILWLILAVFFLKGAFLAAVFPAFEGQDEARHYNTVQFFNEPKEKTWEIKDGLTDSDQDKDDLSTYRFSEEIKKTASAIDNNLLRGEKFNTMIFSPGNEGLNEAEINSRQWPSINKLYPVDMTGKNGQNLYHRLSLFIENGFENRNILVRFYLIRIFSVLLATATLFVSYLIVKSIGFSQKASLLLVAIMAFHPNFAFYTTNINYAPLLFLAFATFTFGAVSYLKNGFGWRNLALMLSAITIGMWTKGTAIVLVVMLIFIFAFDSYGKISKKYKSAKYFIAPVFLVASILILVFFGKHLPLSNGIAGLPTSFWEYTKETITIGKFSQSSGSYWGLIGWTDSFFIKYVRDFIWLIQTFAIAGIGMYFFTKKKLPDFLPEKKYYVFLLSMIVALQLGVRLADWQYFDRTGDIGLGAPGRYFLPNLMAHVVLVYVGLGMLFAYFKREKWFENSLKVGLIFMFSLSMYLIFNVIIYRYYLL